LRRVPIIDWLTARTTNGEFMLPLVSPTEVRNLPWSSVRRQPSRALRIRPIVAVPPSGRYEAQTRPRLMAHEAAHSAAGARRRSHQTAVQRRLHAEGRARVAEEDRARCPPVSCGSAARSRHPSHPSPSLGDRWPRSHADERICVRGPGRKRQRRFQQAMHLSKAPIRHMADMRICGAIEMVGGRATGCRRTTRRARSRRRLGSRLRERAARPGGNLCPA
jgi:hypothetical protein